MVRGQIEYKYYVSAVDEKTIQLGSGIYRDSLSAPR